MNVINVVGLILGLYWFGPWFILPAMLVGIRIVHRGDGA